MIIDKYSKWEKFFTLLFLLLLGVHIYFIFVGITGSIIDIHGFRQTQTAITSYYLAADGFSLNYQTPVFGYPWTIPFEFPIYQWMVAQVHLFSHTSLDVSGRLVSIAAFYTMLLAVFVLLKYLSYSRTERFIIVSFVLFNPTLLFWGRTFMIESTVTLLGVLYLLSVLKLIQKYQLTGHLRYSWLFLALILGSLTSLTKITTFVVYILCSLPFLASMFYKYRDDKKTSSLLKDASVLSFFIFFVPVVLGLVWTSYTDKIRVSNFLTSHFFSAHELRKWMLGTLSQRLSLNTWVAIDDNSFHYLSIGISITLLAFLFSLKYRKHIAVFISAALAGPLLFTNLYIVHDYYSSANTLLYSLSIGLFALSIWDKRQDLKLFLPGFAFVLFTLWLSSTLYLQRYYRCQVQHDDGLLIITDGIKRLSSPNDVLLIRGQDWSSEVPYYSERRAVCMPNLFFKDIDADPEAFLTKLKSSGINSYAVFTHATEVDSTDKKIIRYYGFDKKPYKLSNANINCFLFLK